MNSFANRSPAVCVQKQIFWRCYKGRIVPSSIFCASNVSNSDSNRTSLACVSSLAKGAGGSCCASGKLDLSLSGGCSASRAGWPCAPVGEDVPCFCGYGVDMWCLLPLPTWLLDSWKQSTLTHLAEVAHEKREARVFGNQGDGLLTGLPVREQSLFI
jgi:hypothetical protein